MGRYKLLDVLGEGGFGIVYLAEQQEPIRRRVALKIVKPGMDSKQVIARFEAERQALALLDHPNIAHIFDAGTTETGRPYFVMGLITGLPITRYCDERRLGIEERLALFAQICGAVHHAHQRGIIHRDIKPSNILVSEKDGEPVPTIIDFGVAKAIGQPLTEQTLFTGLGQFIGTPAYMSPEQAEGGILAIDTRTDIYSLGVVLYELLTGCTPFDAEDLRSRGPAQMQRLICEQDPPRPSTRLQTLGGKLEEVAGRRRAAAEQLRKSVRGDLDSIVMKTLEKDRTHRYGTAQALAEDIERHLQHLPVRAGPPSVVYRVRRYVRRQRTRVLVGLCLLIVVLLSAAILGQYLKSRPQRKARKLLALAQTHYEKGWFPEARIVVNGLLVNPYVGAQARLLLACVDLDRPGVNVSPEELEAFRQGRGNSAAQANLLLAKVYREKRAADGATARQWEQKAGEHLQEVRRLVSPAARTSLHLSLALLSDTPAECRERLAEALKQDPNHVEARRARALACQISGDYVQMESDARVITKVARDHPEGYGLRALALRGQAEQSHRRELLTEALAEHARAIERAPTGSRYHDQRRETYMRLGDYRSALADARECLRRSPGEALHHFHAFCALTALGEYAEAEREYEEYLDPRKDKTPRFWIWATTYARDVVVRDWPWHPEGREPNGVAFTFLRQSIEAHRRLAQKAECVARQGLVGTWSPDGSRLAYSRGCQGYTVLEVLDYPAGTRRLVSYNGFDPVWSPEGRYLAFVRDRRTLCLEKLAEGRETYVPQHAECELWLVDAEGTRAPRRLTAGCYPSWSRDGQRLYYYLHEEWGHLCSLSVAGDPPQPTRVMRAASPFPAVSPDEKCVVWHHDDVAELVTLPEGNVVEKWTGFYPTWSPDGKSLVFSRFEGRPDGVWVCNLEERTAARIVEDWMCFQCSWAPQTGRIALSPALLVQQGEGYAHWGMWSGLWVQPLDRRLLGPGSSAPTRKWPRD
jgi:tetratricopeptide (TPR) repeat protein